MKTHLLDRNVTLFGDALIFLFHSPGALALQVFMQKDYPHVLDEGLRAVGWWYFQPERTPFRWGFSLAKRGKLAWLRTHHCSGFSIVGSWGVAQYARSSAARVEWASLRPLSKWVQKAAQNHFPVSNSSSPAQLYLQQPSAAWTSSSFSTSWKINNA